MDGSGKIELDEWLAGLMAQEPFSKMIVRQQIMQREKEEKLKLDQKEARDAGKKVPK